MPKNTNKTVVTTTSTPRNHSERCHKFFMNAINRRNRIWVHIDNVYDEPREEFEGHNVPVYCANISILTEEMLKYDADSFSNENIIDYRPYFIKFCAYDVEANRLRERRGNWYYAKFVDKNQGIENGIVIEGEVEYSASPIIYRRRRLFIENNALSKQEQDRINDTYDLSAHVKDTYAAGLEFNKILNGVSFQNAYIFKVGNGNLIHVTGQTKRGQGFSMFYDIGYHRRSYRAGHVKKPRERYNRAIQKLKTLQSDMVILSHWDDDHIMGCAYAKEDMYKCPWFAPDIDRNTSTNARRVACYVAKVSCISLIERNDLPKIVYQSPSTNSSIGIYMGCKCSGHSRANCEGLIINIKNNSNNKDVESLFHGDVPYESVDSIVWGRRASGFDYLIVPHHGGKMVTRPLRASIGQGIAIVCGDNSPDYRPNKSHKEALEKANYCVYVTEDIDKYAYRIDLCKKSIVMV